MNKENTLGAILTVGQLEMIMTNLDELTEEIPKAINYTQDISYELAISQVKTDPPVTALVHAEVTVTTGEGTRKTVLHDGVAR